MLNYGTDAGTCGTLRMGDDIPQVVGKVNFLQADGNELFVIRRDFTNIPMSNKGQVKWIGDMAYFIFLNLDLWN